MPQKRVQINPDEQFANIKNIMGAIHLSEQSRRNKMTPAMAAEKASRAAAAATLESMCFQWQLSFVDFCKVAVLARGAQELGSQAYRSLKPRTLHCEASPELRTFPTYDNSHNAGCECILFHII
jgi:hypothetical protein